MGTKNYVKDLIDRTLCNLRFIEKSSKNKDNNVYEVTQLVNSLLILIILPKEFVDKNKIGDIRGKKLKELIELGYPGEFIAKFSDLGDLLEKMRHSIAHVDFKIKNENKLMSSVNFLNHDPAQKMKKTLDVTISIEDLRLLVEKIAETIKSSI
jgi:HEPN pEK499 p136